MVVGIVIGVGLGGGAVWLVQRARAGALGSEVVRLGQQVEHAQALADEKTKYAERVDATLSETIEAAAARAVKGNNEEFLSLAGQRLAPIDERLRGFETQLRELEVARQGAYGSLTAQVRSLLEAQEGLRSETGKLATALQRPGVRGRWGEATLRRLVELAGMVDHCDFVEQGTVEGSEGRIRPDLVVRMPGGGAVIVDAKTPLDAYLAALEHDDERARDASLDEHVQAMRDHMAALSRKSYWEQFDDTPDFVVMFVPVESAVAAALVRRPELFEEGQMKKVVLATPSSFIPMLRVVAMGWRDEQVAAHAKEISELGRELHKRLASMAKGVATLGTRLDGAVQAYNSAVGSLELKVLPQARRFSDLGAGSGQDIAELEAVENEARSLKAPELLEAVERVRELGPGVAIDDDDFGTLGRAASDGG